MPSIDDGACDSRIGAGTKVSGKLSFRGTTRVEGEAEGEIRGDEIIITNTATVSAKITAARLSIAGKVSGELVASERVELLASARAKCSITTPRLVLNEGAQFDGDCHMPHEAEREKAGESAPRLTAVGGGDSRS
jgi:cytoskeletal protein CcmA (bactofilin family)